MAIPLSVYNIYTLEECRTALAELHVCLDLVNQLNAQWPNPDGCTDEISRALQDRYDKLRAVIAEARPAHHTEEERHADLGSGIG
jgi:hypothetical protein